MRTNRGITVKLYAVNTSYISTATRLHAELKPLRMPKPIKPIIAIAKPSSTPVRNSTISTISEKIPRATSLILPSRYPDDVGNQNQTFDRAGEPYSEYHRIEGELEGR